MMPPFSDRGPRGDHERGIVIVLVAISIIALFALTGLAVDAANLYRSRLLLQKAADAAVLGGISYPVQRGTSGMNDDALAAGLPGDDPETYRKLVERRAQEILEDNLRLAHIAHAPCRTEDGFEVCASYDSSSRVIAIDLTASVSLYLMQLVPFQMLRLQQFTPQLDLKATAQASRPPAHIALVLDVSGSMGCPSGSSDCSCMQTQAGCAVRVKIADLVDGVHAFFDYFDIHNDKFGIIPFNTRASPIPGGFDNLPANVPLTDATVQCILAGQQPVQTCIDFPPLLRPAGNTNIADALMEAYEEMTVRMPARLGTTTPQEISYLLFTDGAPDAGRFLFANPTTAMPVSNAEGLGSYDYIHYTVRWQPDVGSWYSGPSLLVKTTAGLYGNSSPTPPAPDPSAPGLYVPQCHQFIDSASGLPQEVWPPSASADFCKVFDGCLGPVAGPSNLGFLLPGQGTPIATDVVCNGSSVLSRENSWRQQYYNIPVAMSDLMRQDRGTFFVIGLGQQATGGVPPYLDLSNSELRNDYFLRRIANDFMHAVYQAATPDPELSFAGYQSYLALQSSPNPREGEYIATPNSSELRDVFRVMARRIALRLTK
ncbi:MAG: VWA domain-containing protein [Bdellovibrionota bacterium]